MAEILVDSAVQVLVEKLIAFASEEIGLILGVKKELASLKDSFTKIQAFLNDASKRQVEEEAAKLWLKDLENIAYEADNLLDEFNYEIVRLTETDSVTVDPIVVGREEDVSMIVDMLVNPNDEGVSVVPIVGMGGLGKTTFARLIFNDQQTVKHFHKRIWVCVSQNFDSTTNLFKRILESVTNNVVKVEGREAILQKLKEELKDKRFLLVLDDLWNDEQQYWEDFRSSLVGINSANGNFIIVTTRSKRVASIVNPRYQHSLGILSDDDCWDIIKMRAFSNEVEVSEHLENIGRKIAGKCGGLPLAANMIGGTLQRKEIDDWTSVLQSGFSDSNGDTSGVLQVLKLSFDRLPSPLLKKCFAYCSIFSEDEIIWKERLIQLWMAEGLLVENDGNDMESLGSRVYDILLQNCFFQEAEKISLALLSSQKCMIWCTIWHAQFQKRKVLMWKTTDIKGIAMPQPARASKPIAFNEEEVLEGLEPHPNIKSLRIEGFSGDNLPSWIMNRSITEELEIKDVERGALLLDMICNNNNNSSSLTINCSSLSHIELSAHNLQSLDTIDISRCKKLKSIRYLTQGEEESSGGFISSLQFLTVDNCNEVTEILSPMVLESCTSLQTLRVSRCQNLVSFPIDFRSLPSGLRVLGISQCPRLRSLPKGGIGRLSGLTELCIGPFSEEVGLASFYEIFQSGIQQLHSLEVLQLYGWPQFESLPDDIQHLTTLREFRIDNFGMEALPEWIGNLASLQWLWVYRCKRLKQLPSKKALQCLTKLSHLSIKECPELTERCQPYESEWHKISHIPNFIL
ncbi:UNVERIFIED_CONTAM: putative disease resistance protein RGA3 [Sesamum angustifolium]|uniref:Disease resistance protein RGA3 n=1 Tax=Sesamum angustifolium TaxID=2727405 RepID=A0AAW2KEJ6_9LAMI